MAKISRRLSELQEKVEDKQYEPLEALNLLKETAENLKPGVHKKYYDVLKDFIINSSLSKENKKLLEQDIAVVIDPLNKGAHDKPVSRKQAEELFIRVCLCLSKIIELKKMSK